LCELILAAQGALDTFFRAYDVPGANA